MVSSRPVGIHQTSMHQLAQVLSNLQQASVVNQTGLPGFYNFKSQTVVTEEDLEKRRADAHARERHPRRWD